MDIVNTLPFRSDEAVMPWLDHCPCAHQHNATQIMHERFLEESTPAPVWQTVIVSLTLVIMFIFMMTDKIGPDWVMAAGLTVFMVTDIITVKEGLEGFSNEGILTVMVLFVVAEGISRTGALDYYMGLIMGRPKTIAGAQIRLMVPIATLSAFLNNTPIVAVMIPLTLRWAKTIGVPKEQLLIPLSYATILGGTCTLVGTSTNLVVQGLLKKNYPNEEAGNIGLFDLAIYGVPNAMIGLAYMMIFAPFLLPMGKSNTDSDTDDLLLGARVKPWSPAAGRTYKRSGLGDSGGIFLVNVRRATTGNVHHAVSKDFVISVGDELYFTGSVEAFSTFCEEHGLEIITTENIVTNEDPLSRDTEIVAITNVTGSSSNRVRSVNRLSDQIGGRVPVETGSTPNNVVVTLDSSEKVILVGINCQDRPGLLMDISNAISSNSLNLRHSEAKVFGDRSLSVWRCESLEASTPDLDVLGAAITNALQVSGVSTSKTSGSRIVRAHVTSSSTLIGKKPIDVDFRGKYKALIVAYQKNGKNALMDSEFSSGDLLVLETLEGSPLLTKPPKGFYAKIDSAKSSRNLLEVESADLEADAGVRQVLTDLKVVFESNDEKAIPKGEFLTALLVTAKSPLVDKSINDLGFSKLPGVVLISVERPKGDSTESLTVDDKLKVGDILWYSGSAEAIADLQRVHGLVFYHQEEMKTNVILQDRRLVQAVVAKGSPLVGNTVKDVHFRSEYGGAVIAIQRGSNRVHEHPANVKLQTGDVLLVEAGPTFMKSHGSNYKTFALVSEVENSSPPRPRLFLLCVVLIIASLTVAALEIRSLLVTGAVVSIVLVSLGIVTQEEARLAIQWDLYVTVAAAFGIGNAMKNSGVATGLATFLVQVGKSIGIGSKIFVVFIICHFLCAHNIVL
jgi:di/tricarboxylate transporter